MALLPTELLVSFLERVLNRSPKTFVRLIQTNRHLCTASRMVSRFNPAPELEFDLLDRTLEALHGWVGYHKPILSDEAFDRIVNIFPELHDVAYLGYSGLVNEYLARGHDPNVDVKDRPPLWRITEIKSNLDGKDLSRGIEILLEHGLRLN